MSYTIELLEVDENIKNAEQYYKQNIASLIEQCKTGAKNISYMAGFSFLEGYIRNRFPGKLDFEKIPYSISFYDMIEAYIGYLSVQKTKKSFEEGKVISHTILLLIDLNAAHSNTNPIRHTFSMEAFDEGSYYKLFRQLKEFFFLQGLDKESYKKFDEIINEKAFFEDQVNGGFLQYYSDSNETFFQRYTELVNFQEEKKILSSTLQHIIENGQLSKIQHISSSYEHKSYNMKLKQFARDEEFLRKLTYSLKQEYIGRDYYKEFKQMIEPNPIQDEILNNCLKTIKNNPEHYVLITGAPGTGKTVVLIRLLIQLMKSNNPSQLVTFSESLELYNKHFSEQYNKNMKAISPAHMRDFQNNLIKSFKDWIKTPLCVFLKVNDLYDFRTDILEYFSRQKKNDRLILSEALKKAESDIWPNLKDLDENDSDMQKLHQVLDERQQKEKRIPFDYAYWKFVKKVTQEDMVTLRINAPCPDYILIDEVQDLTLAQLESAKKIAKYGAILAGDLNQCIRQNYTDWNNLGINPKYGNELTHNYRTSYNIQKLSNLYLEKSGKHTYTLNDENRIQGPKPQLFVSKEETEYSYDNTCKQIAYSVRMLLKSCNREMKDIFIVASNKEELDKIYSNLILINDGVKIHFLKSSDNDNNKLFSENSIKLGTIESIKGIDCPILLFLITQDLINNSNSELVQDSIYAVINRAMHLLEVFMPNHSFESEPVCNLIDLLKSNNFSQEISLLDNVHYFYPERVKKYYQKSTGSSQDFVYGKLKDGRDGHIKLILLNKFSVEDNDVLNYAYKVKITKTDKHKQCCLIPVEKLEKGRIVEHSVDGKNCFMVQSNNKFFYIHKQSCTCYNSLKKDDDVCFDARLYPTNGSVTAFAVDVDILPK